ncbi:hypothetical protein [Anaerocolumna jejuensis]|uniref:hypothetical protein n=1 Tax=Anaerocolumna jejuensis TaxID=259063 RepID=UPI003F7CA341
MQKNKPVEAVVRICEFCRTEMTGSYQHIKTKRGSDLYICNKCLAGQTGKNKAV